MIDTKDTIRFTIICKHKTRIALSRGVSRRILNSVKGSALAYAQPSFASLIKAIVERKLKFPSEPEEITPITKKSVIMLYLYGHVHKRLNEEAAKLNISATKHLVDIIEKVDFKQLNLIYQNNLVLEQMVPCSYKLLTENRYIINREIARRMISTPKGAGKADFDSVGKIINEIIASYFEIPLPIPEPLEPVVDNEEVRFTIIMSRDLNQALRDYCDKQIAATGDFHSVNSTIVKWIEEAAEDEMW